jgi:glycosyltransferase involved in cell wall biosynthesis
MRVAWLGPVGDVGGVPTMGALLLKGALDQGVEVDFFALEDTSVPSSLLEHPLLRVVRTPTWWRWGKWYSRNPMMSFASSMIARPQAHRKLCGMIREEHKKRPYDCLFQFSQIELFKLGEWAGELPPIVVFPCVHAYGELHWHRIESAYARQSEGSLMHYVVRAMLMYRSRVQRRDLRKPRLIMGLSKRFNQLLAQDYKLPPERLVVSYHPIGTAGAPLSPNPEPGQHVEPIKLLYVSRISVRKGVEQIIELSKRLDDLHGHIEIQVIGNRSQWSDYTSHLKELNPRVARRLGGIRHAEMQALYDGGDILLLPSMYEPGGLVVGEALSRGMCVVASDEVGSAEAVAPGCCTLFPAGDMDAFERVTREMIARRRAERPQLRKLASAEAVRLFEPSKAAAELVAVFECAKDGRPFAMPQAV